MTAGDRIFSDKVDIDQEAVSKFFEDRAKVYSDKHPVVAVIYQDSNPELAESRDKHEKNVVLPILALSPTDSVLDMGCGIGRWADALYGRVARYHGTDISKGLVEIAARRFEGRQGFTFQALKAQDNAPDNLSAPPPFDLIIVTGLFAYLNEQDCMNVLGNIERNCNSSARIFIREPMGIEKRLTLKNIWSDELKHDYNAIYRTAEEYREMLKFSLMSSGFVLEKDEPLFPPSLANRAETTQRFFFLTRSGR